jgi:hypothetical protein
MPVLSKANANLILEFGVAQDCELLRLANDPLAELRCWDILSAAAPAVGAEGHFSIALAHRRLGQHNDSARHFRAALSAQVSCMRRCSTGTLRGKRGWRYDSTFVAAAGAAGYPVAAGDDAALQSATGDAPSTTCP